MKLLIQPGDGITPLVKSIDRARKSVEIVIFRFDRLEIERALEEAVKRGVSVHALIAFTNRGGEANLRKLEMRFLARGITVARTADDLVRYHGKMVLIDRQDLHLLGFNFTHLDTDHSRSFGVVTRNRALVEEAGKLFDADTKRCAYVPGCANFLVSPINARKELQSFLKGARKELLIYDVKIADREMIRLLEDRARAGVDIRIVGKIARDSKQLAVRTLGRMRLHTRTIVRDRQDAFIGSQSLRELELDARREIGIIFRDKKIIAAIRKVFEEDWNAGAIPMGIEDQPKAPIARVAKRVAKSVAKRLPPVSPVLSEAVREVLREHIDLEIDHQEVEEAVKSAVKQAVKEAVREVVEDAVA